MSELISPNVVANDSEKDGVSDFATKICSANSASGADLLLDIRTILAPLLFIKRVKPRNAFDLSEIEKIMT